MFDLLKQRMNMGHQKRGHDRNAATVIIQGFVNAEDYFTKKNKKLNETETSPLRLNP